jgi:hypothetical protein
LDDRKVPTTTRPTNGSGEDMELNHLKVIKKKEGGKIEPPNLHEIDKKPKVKNGLQEVSPLTFSIPWNCLPSTSAYLGWVPPMYGMGQPMYQRMVGGQTQIPHPRYYHQEIILMLS